MVVERLAEPGDMAMPGKPLARLYDENALRVELEVPEDLARNIEAGRHLRLGLTRLAPCITRSGERDRAASDPASRSFLVRAPLPSGQHLQPGMFARATFAVGSEAVLTAAARCDGGIGQLETVRVYLRRQNSRPGWSRWGALWRSDRDARRTSAGRPRDSR